VFILIICLKKVYKKATAGGMSFVVETLKWNDSMSAAVRGRRM